MGRLKPLYWRARYAAWPPRGKSSRPREGYAVLVPVPGDMPFLVDVALSVLAVQSAAHRLETIVLPDVPSAEARRTVEAYAPRWTGPLRLLDLAVPEKIVLPRLGDPGKNHAAQLLRGTSATDASHVVFHDADLFPLDEELHERTFAACSRPDVDVAGLEGPWDPWFAQHDRDLVATWEMCARVSWMRRFAPWRHIGHVAVAAGESRTFDTTFWPQWSTEQARLRTVEATDRYIHFNYVISTYRKFQRQTGPFRDASFRLLLLRLLIDTFDTSGRSYALPTLDELERGIADPSCRVHYLSADAPMLLTMTTRLRRILAGPWARVDTEDALQRLQVFEDWAAATVGSPSE